MNDQEIELEDINFSKQIVVENNIEQKINNDLLVDFDKDFSFFSFVSHFKELLSNSVLSCAFI